MAPVAPQAEDPHQIELIKQYAPSGIKSLRACIRCRLIMAKEQFIQYGCPSCKDVLSMQDDEGRVLACTSSTFQGFITSIRPGAFVSRFNGLEKRLPGCYALTVQGTIPDYILHESEYERDSDGEGVAEQGEIAGRSPSLHLTDESEAEPLQQAKPEKKKQKKQKPEAKPAPKADATSPPSSPSSAAPGTPSDKGLFSPDNGAVDEVLKGLFSPPSPEGDEKDKDKDKDTAERKRKRLAEGSTGAP
uniref:Spt4/RpoE2 zinc finger domain-containing protein n=1 Tax=Alexandrium monilatum TaxID=311494 RepID=A0A7S4R8B0_9DINO